MKSRAALAIVAANLVALLVLAVLMPRQMIMPGALIQAHESLTDDCFACHAPFIGSTPAKCIACHAVADIGLKTTKGRPIARERKLVAFHQHLMEDDCVACHSDHRGVQAFRPISAFSHALLDPVLQEKCEGCHAKPVDSLHRNLRGSCGECHTQERWTPATFDHERHFRFDKDHTTECTTCHVGGDYSRYTCYGCHEHSRSKIREEHVEEGILDYEDCAECHRSADEDEEKRHWRSMRSGSRRENGREIRRHERGERHDD